MIERLSGMPDGTLGFRAWGEVSRDDFSAGALLADTKTGLTLGLGHVSSWKRCALATDVDWVRHAVELLGWMTPGEVRLFGHGELADARAWVAE